MTSDGLGSGPLPVHPVRDPGAAPPPSKARAVWALTLSLVPAIVTVVVAAVLAITVLVDSARENRDHGTRMAIAALAITGCWIAVGVVVLTVLLMRGDIEAAARSASDPSARSDAYLLTEVGVEDCLAGPPAEGQEFVAALDVVPCSEPHRGEVYATFELTEWKNDRAAQRRMLAECDDRFLAFMAIPFEQSTSDVYAFSAASKNAWALDPRVACAVFVGEDVTGSLRGARL